MLGLPSAGNVEDLDLEAAVEAADRMIAELEDYTQILRQKTGDLRERAGQNQILLDQFFERIQG